VEEEAEWDEK